MKLIIPAMTAGNYQSKIANNFGRADYFALINTKNDHLEFFENKAALKKGGAGVAAAQICADHGADIIAAYHFGPKAAEAIEAAGIRQIQLKEQKSIKEAYNDYQLSKLVEQATTLGNN